ncbi:MAG: plastocyanin/azurin family copper-binding protein [Gemmatimonadales bacterium]
MAAIGVAALAGAARLPRPADPVARHHVVEIRGMAFHPEVVEVRRGDTVVWINRDIVPHTATASRTEEWTTGPLSQGAQGTLVPDRRGDEAYFCEFHPTMLGTLIVR